MNRTRRTGADLAYERLRRRILALDLAPGDDLDEHTLCAECGVSRTPLREALIRLAAEHLLVLLPNRGYAVAPLRLTDLPQFIEALSVTQGAVYALAATRRTEADLRRIEDEARGFAALAAGGDTEALTEQNRAFHLAAGEACRNEFFVASYRHLLDESVRLARTCATYDTDKERSVAEHRALLDALTRRDPDTAERIGRAHALSFQRQIVAYLERHDVDAVRPLSKVVTGSGLALRHASPPA